MSAEEVLTLVKIPIAEVEEWIRTKHILPSVLTEFRLEESNLVFVFKEDEEVLSSQSSKPARKRRTRRKRNRMKTRGWEVVARITNSKGQKCTIYKPFVDVLQDQDMTHEEQRKLVERILKSNRNRPSDASVQYFLENTLEYLKEVRRNDGLQERAGHD